MRRSHLLTVAISLQLFTTVIPSYSQVSNDNEDGVYKIDRQSVGEFVPGQVLIKFQDESSVSVRHNAKGRFLSANISGVDQLLREFGVNDMEKLFPTAKPKPKAQLRRKIAPNGGIVQEKNLDKVFLVKSEIMSTDSTLQLVKRLKELPDVEYAEPNYYAYISSNMASSLPEDYTPARQQVLKAPVSTETTASMICSNPSQNPMYTQQYGITQQNIQQLWNKPIINKKRPVIAILDTGVDINHPDLKDNIWQNTKEVEGEAAYDDDGNGIVDDKYGWNFVDDYYELTDRCGHGTHCAGIAAAADNGIGIIGANPLALIMPVKVLKDCGAGDVATICRGIAYAVENGADIISMSFGLYVYGSTDCPRALANALDLAYQTAILVAAAGNDAKSIYERPSPFYPAAYYLVLGVEASDSNGQRAKFSNYDPDGPVYSAWDIDGPNYEIQVPGVDIYSTWPNGYYNLLNGTSMATPLFAGAVSALQMVKDYPSRDVLYADLIHLKADFAKIYSDDTPRIPQIDLVSLNVDDNVEGNTNIDGQVDVGETIRFYPVLRNTWADATDIRLKLTVDPVYAGFVEIENPEVDFGYSISAYGRETAKTPIKVKFANNIGDNTRIKFILEVSYSENSEGFSKVVYQTVNNMVKIGGLITEDRTLTADHVYYINTNLGIPKGVTLTIEPGTRLEFDSEAELASFGKLLAHGTPEKPIVFSGHKGGVWAGIRSHESDESKTGYYLYTNDAQTLFTLLPTDKTPYRLDINTINNLYRLFYNDTVEPSPQMVFSLTDYLDVELESFYSPNFGGFIDGYLNMNIRSDKLTDINFLTPAVLQMKNDMQAYYNSFPDVYKSWSDVKPNQAGIYVDLISWFTSANPIDTLSYCRIEDGRTTCIYLKDCILKSTGFNNAITENAPMRGTRNLISGTCKWAGNNGEWIDLKIKNSNIVNNSFDLVGFGTQYYEQGGTERPKYSRLNNNNFFNNTPNKTQESNYWLANKSESPNVDIAKYPSYLGTGREDLVRPHLWEIGNAPGTYGSIDLSNMRTTPVTDTHGIVWKVCVNGKDAQDEFEDLSPLGVGRHKFEVYFNRPMNKAVIPQISFGVREPYNQHSVEEDGSWNADGTIYTAYYTITGKTMSDGLCRIYVQGAEDSEYFECPYEKDRFNINIQAAGLMATGFAAEAGMGRVTLTWNNDNNDFDDAMGFNVYRFNPDKKRTIPAHYDERMHWIEETEVVDTLTLNTEILDIETTSFIDYDVTPGETYYYLYRVLNTDLQEYDVSNVVAATPLTSTRGDANGSGYVDVADVITTVNYAAGFEPKPFIFEAADMNADQMINIVDVISIIMEILNPGSEVRAMAEATATYTIEDGILYVESPVALAGVQVQLALNEELRVKNEEFATADDLDGFEQASAWLSDYDYLFLAYNINGQTLSPGKHALLHIGNGLIGQMYLSDAAGHNVEVIGDEATKVNRMASDVMNVPGIYDLKGRKLTGDSTQEGKLPKGVYIINGRKVVK